MHSSQPTFLLLLIGSVILLALLAGLGIGLFLILTSKTSRNGDMACGTCGYAVRGLTQLNCPECGADLRESGIRPAGSKNRHTLGVALCISCGAILLGSCVLSGILFGTA